MALGKGTYTRCALIEEIISKAYQVDSISIIAPEARLQELNTESIASLFELTSNLSREVVALAEQVLALEGYSA